MTAKRTLLALFVVALGALPLFAQQTSIQVQQAGSNVFFGKGYFKMNFASGCTAANVSGVLTISCSGSGSFTAGGDLSGTSSAQTVTGVQGKAITLATGFLNYTGTVWAFTALTPASVGLGSVTNDAQTKAAIVPNTAPGAGQVLLGNAGATAYAPQTLTNDCTISSLGAITCTKTNGAAFGTFATANAATPPAIGNTTPAAGTFTTVATTGVGTVLLCPEAADPGAPGASSDSLNCSNAYHRLTAYFNNVGPLVLGTWGITTPGGFNVGGAVQVNGINTESAVPGNSSGTGLYTESSTGVGSWTPLPVSSANGGTGVASPTAHAILLGEGASPATALACAAGALVVGGGASADPACSATPVIGGVGLGTATITFSGNTAGTAVIGCANATCTAFGGNKAMQAINYTTVTNCVTNSACGAATAGMASIAAAATTVTVSTTSVTLNSEIKLQFDATLGGAAQLNVTCNTGTSTTASYWVSTRTPGTSFVITTNTTPVTNPACLSWTLNN